MLATLTAGMSAGVTTSPDGESPDSSARSNNLVLLYSPKETASFLSRRCNVGTNPDLAFASFGQDSRMPDKGVLGKFPHSQYRPSLITPPRFKVPAHSDPVKRGNFREADWTRFCLLTGESIERLPPPDMPNIERTHQDFCESLLSAAKHVGRTMCHAGTKSARPSIAPSSEPQWGLTLTEPLRPYYLDCNRRSRIDGRKLLIPSASRTLAARCGEQSTNLLAGLDAPLACAPSRQIPSPRNLWRTRHAGPLAVSLPGSSTSTCPIYGRFQHLRLTVSLNPFGQRCLLLPSDAWSQESLRDWIPSSRSSHSTPGQLGNLGFATSSVPTCANSKFQRSGEEG